LGTPLPTTLSGLSVQIQSSGGAINFPLFYASSTQINVQIPWELSGQQNASINAAVNGNAGAAQGVSLSPFSPGIFAAASGQGAIVDTLSRLVDATNPTTAGSVIVVYCTGRGAVENPPDTGAPASNAALSPTITTPEVMIGGIDAPVLFSGLAPGTVGEYQVNVQVPAGIPVGSAVPVAIFMGGVSSNTVTVAVR
jgi:minor extracellular serine protease Vpr